MDWRIPGRKTDSPRPEHHVRPCSRELPVTTWLWDTKMTLENKESGWDERPESGYEIPFTDHIYWACQPHELLFAQRTKNGSHHGTVGS